MSISYNVIGSIVWVESANLFGAVIRQNHNQYLVYFLNGNTKYYSPQRLQLVYLNAMPVNTRTIEISKVSLRAFDGKILTRNTTNYIQTSFPEVDDEDSEFSWNDNVYYKNYTIKLEKDKDDWWHYEIEGYPEVINNSGSHFAKDLAIDEAKGRIDDTRLS